MAVPLPCLVKLKLSWLVADSVSVPDSQNVPSAVTAPLLPVSYWNVVHHPGMKPAQSSSRSLKQFSTAAGNTSPPQVPSAPMHVCVPDLQVPTSRVAAGPE